MNGDVATAVEHPGDGTRHARRWPAFVRGLRGAVVVLTRIPLGGFPYSDADWKWTAAYFPFVGMMLGVLLGGIWHWVIRAGFVVAAVVSIAVSMLITGAIHEDGLADTADALGSGTNRERVLAILKDSRIGAFGSVALATTIALRAALLTRMGAAAPVALVFSSSASRLVPVWLMSMLPYVTDPAVAKSRAVVASGRAQVVIATASVTMLSVVLVVLHSFALVEVAAIWASMLAVALVCGARFKARVGGITGDFLGAAQQMSECATLLALAMMRGGPP